MMPKPACHTTHPQLQALLDFQQVCITFGPPSCSKAMAGNHFSEVEWGADDRSIGYVTLCHSHGKSAEKLSDAWD